MSCRGLPPIFFSSPQRRGRGGGGEFYRKESFPGGGGGGGRGNLVVENSVIESTVFHIHQFVTYSKYIFDISSRWVK